MLYLLKHEGGSTFYYLISGKEYVVGRKNADITIADDQSISRKHAIFKVENESIKLIDCGSKYGTCHKGTRIEANTEVQLEDQDIIKFGVYQSIYKLEKVNVVTTGSGLSSLQKNALKKDLEVLGGTFLNNWHSTCTHLTLQEIILTIKVLEALIDDKPFVTLEYWKRFVQNFKTNQAPPKIEDFKPPVAEMLLDTSTLNPNPQRKVLFKDKIFVFPTEKIKSKVEQLISKTGGKCISWDKQPIALSQITNSKINYIFIHSDEIKDIPESLKNAYEYLAKIDQRTIPVQEIAMAVLMCSCEKDCNPRFNRIERVFMKKENNSCSEMFPLALETQTQPLLTQPNIEEVIPGSLIADSPVKLDPVKEQPSMVNLPSTSSSKSSSTPTPSKRVMEESEVNPFKKIKLDNSTSKPKQQFGNEPKKRKAEEVPSEVPPKKSSLKENPFAIMRNKNVIKKVASDNPFTGLRLKQEKNLDDNPFVNAIEENADVIVIDEIAPEKKHSPSISDITKSEYNRSNNESRITNLSDIKWLSRTSCKSEDLDVADEYKEIYNRFKNSIVIEVLPSVARRVSLLNISDESIRSTNGKNFKKFKKVRPLKPQHSIIRTSAVHNANTTEKEIPVLSDGEEDEEYPRPVPKKVNKSKRFAF